MTRNGSQIKHVEGRDEKSGRFLTGNNGGGRSKGSRNLLTTEFLDSVYHQWQKHGDEVLSRVIRDQPHQFLKIVAGLMPAKLDQTMLTVNIDLAEARSYDEAFQLALNFISSRTIDVTEHVDAD